MEKPSKSRRRRSIRNLRASTGFYSAPEEANYGSAWIDQDQETNMDNLVMSLSQLTCDDKQADGSNSTSEESNTFCSHPQYLNNPTVEDSTNNLWEESRFGDKTTDDPDMSPTVPFYTSFSFGEDMPLNLEFVETDMERANSPTSFSYATLSKTYNSECVENDQECNEINKDTNSKAFSPSQNAANEYRYGAEFFEEYPEQENNLSLNFSPLPEEDLSINFLVKSLNCSFNLSFSSEDDRPDTPTFSPHQNDKGEENIMSSLQQTSDIQTSPNVNISENNSHELNHTFIISQREQEADPIRSIAPLHKSLILPSDPHDVQPEDNSGTNFLLENVMKAFDTNDIHVEHYENACVDLPQTCVPNGSICPDSFDANNMTPDIVTHNSVQENAYSEGVKESCTHLNIESHEEPRLDRVSCDVSEIASEKQKKRKKRRSSRQFQLQEFSVAFRDPDDNSPRSVISVVNCDTHDQHPVKVFESEKENLYDDISELSYSYTDNLVKSVLSDCSNNQSIEKEKINRRKSSGRKLSKKKCLSVETDSLTSSHGNNDVPCFHADDHTESDLPQGQCDTNCDTFQCDQISRIALSTNSEQTPVLTDGCDENESAPSGRQLRTKRKSWGVSLSRPVRKPKGVKESQERSTSPDNIDLEQIYGQKKYSPITPRLLETIREVPSKGLAISKQKLKRSINFPEDYRPTVWKIKSRAKKAIKHFKKHIQRNVIDEDEFRSRLQDIMVDLAEFDN